MIDVGRVRRVFSDVRVVVRVMRDICVAIVIVPAAIFRRIALIAPRLVRVAPLQLPFPSTFACRMRGARGLTSLQRS